MNKKTWKIIHLITGQIFALGLPLIELTTQAQNSTTAAENFFSNAFAAYSIVVFESFFIGESLLAKSKNWKTWQKALIILLFIPVGILLWNTVWNYANARNTAISTMQAISLFVLTIIAIINYRITRKS